MSKRSITLLEANMYRAIFECLYGKIAEGDEEGLKDMGVTALARSKILVLSPQEFLAFAPHSLKFNFGFGITVDEEQVCLFVESIKTTIEKEAEVVEFIKMGAPQSMASAVLGISDREYRRQKAKLRFSLTEGEKAPMIKGRGVQSNAKIEAEIGIILREKRSGERINADEFKTVAQRTGANYRDIWACYQEYERLAL